jgi:hypothetical protein
MRGQQLKISHQSAPVISPVLGLLHCFDGGKTVVRLGNASACGREFPGEIATAHERESRF